MIFRRKKKDKAAGEAPTERDVPEQEAPAEPAEPESQPEPELESDHPVYAPPPVSYDAPVGSAARAESGEGRGGGWLKRLRSGLSRSSGKVGGGIGEILTKRKLDEEALEELEELLISADLGVEAASRVTAELARHRFEKEADAEQVKAALAEIIAATLKPVARPLDIDPAKKPHVVLVVGVNGSGKTTTIGKLARQWVDGGRKVHLAAGDTFRAAAVEQLQIWGQRTGCPVTSRDTGADAAGLAYDALQEARREGADVLLIDTAGRLHNKEGLMAELQKIIRVLRKLDDSAPHDVVLVLDATVGQNALQQVRTFKELVNVSGLVVTKLDGSARGGVLVALAEAFGLPVHAVGVGETAEDLRPFSARAFGRALVGLDPEG